MSTGMASLTELAESVEAIRSCNNDQIILLKCTSAYPATPKDANLASIPHLSNLFNVFVGLSDHTAGIGVAVASVVLGARVIEKHFTISRDAGGPDAAFSLEPHEMKSLVEESAKAFDAIGQISYGRSSSEIESLKFRRSIFAVKDISAGECFTQDNLRIIRPGYGLAPKHFEAVIGRKAKQNIKRGTPLKWDYFE